MEIEGIWISYSKRNPNICPLPFGGLLRKLLRFSFPEIPFHEKK
jgi:hypothetical protein